MKNSLRVAVLFLIFLATTGASDAQAPDYGYHAILPDPSTNYWLPVPLVPDLQPAPFHPSQDRDLGSAVTGLSLDRNGPALDKPFTFTQGTAAATRAQDVILPNIQVSHSGSVSGASQPVTDFSEVMVSLDPTDPQHLLGTAKFFFDSPNYGFYSGVFESYDGGFTWTQLQPAGVENYDLTSDPVTTFDDQGNGYFTLLTRGPTGVDMLKKPASGNWQLPVVVDRTTIADKQWIIGDQDPQNDSPYAGNLYMSWKDLRTSWMVFARSTDSNQTWSAPLQIASGDVQASVPGVAPDGTVYVVYGRHIYYGPVSGAIEFVKSTDGGASFTAPSVIANITSIPFTFPNSTFRTTASFPAFAVSPVDGSLYVAWSDYRHGDADIYFTRSTDDGANWDTPLRLNDDPLNNGVDQFQPQVSVAPNGRVAVMWFDRRLPCPDLPWIPSNHVGRANYCIDTYMTRSYDGGQTWVPNFRVSAQTWDWSLNLPLTFDGDGFIGDYQGVASNDQYDFPFWNATANLGENPQNHQQAFVARVPVPFVNLAPQKSAQPAVVSPGGLLTYTIMVDNVGPDDAASVRLTDTLPISTTYVPGSLAYPPGAGQGGYDAVDNAVTWTGALSVGVPLTLTFQVTVGHFVADAILANTVVITNGVGFGYQRAATTTVNLPPFILTAAPVDGAFGVPLTAPLVITFSESVLPGTLDYTVTPDPGVWTAAWDFDNSVVTLDHADWVYPQAYTVTVAARDEQGASLVPGPVPNPWSFTTLDPPPQIVATSPVQNATGVTTSAPLVITFSEPVSPDTLRYTVTPDPGGWTVAWNGSHTAATLGHDDWDYGRTYNVAVEARDLDGLELVPGAVPNPWSFTILGAPPQIVGTSPADGATGVWVSTPLVVTFSEPVNPDSLRYTVRPDPGGWTVAWSAGNTVATLGHADWAFSHTYSVAVEARDLDNLPLVSGALPNPWSFTTGHGIYLPLVLRNHP
jgi:uncharacterized repeat protein (TIGR01451 family)